MTNADFTKLNFFNFELILQKFASFKTVKIVIVHKFTYFIDILRILTNDLQLSNPYFSAHLKYF